MKYGIKNVILRGVLRLGAKGYLPLLSDGQYLKIKYKYIMNKKLDINNPRTFNEKLQWLKLYNRRNEYTMMVDKYEVRNYIGRELGEKYLIPLLGVWNTPEDINFEMLPNQFVLKCNHNSGLGMCICTDKSKLNIKKVIAELKKGLAQDYYLTGREWPYKDVPRKIIAEQYIADTPVENKKTFGICGVEDTGLTDYKFFCFDGVADSVMVCIDRNSGNPKFYFFNKEWKLCRYNIRGINAPSDFTLPKPKNIDKMFEIAEYLSQGIPFVRVDLYNSNGKIYFGELTFFPDSGFDNNLLPETDRYFGSLINLERIKYENNRISD